MRICKVLPSGETLGETSGPFVGKGFSALCPAWHTYLLPLHSPPQPLPHLPHLTNWSGQLLGQAPVARSSMSGLGTPAGQPLCVT